MSLERWLKPDKNAEKPEEKEDKTVKRAEKIQSKKSSTERTVSSTQKSLKLIKYVLICTRANCKYQKTIMKKNLSDKDKVCPKCKSKMKVK